MIAFLLTVLVIGALMYAGYRLTIYLYTCGAMDISTNQVQPVVGESFGIRPLRSVEMEERDYGLRYARVGILIIVAFLLVLVVGIVAALLAVL